MEGTHEAEVLCPLCHLQPECKVRCSLAQQCAGAVFLKGQGQSHITRTNNLFSQRKIMACYDAMYLCLTSAQQEIGHGCGWEEGFKSPFLPFKSTVLESPTP